MPSTSKKQHNFMAAIAHNPAFAKKVGVPQSVGRDFSNADKGKTFKKGGDTMAKTNPFMAMIAKKKADAAGKMPMKKMAKGGMTGSSLDAGNSTSMQKVKTKPGTIDGVAIRGKTRGKQFGIDGPKKPSNTKS
jgi:hypothetical protein